MEPDAARVAAVMAAVLAVMTGSAYAAGFELQGLKAADIRGKAATVSAAAAVPAAAEQGYLSADRLSN